AVPPIVVQPSDAGRPEPLLGRRRDSAPSAADGHLLSPSPSPSDGSLLPSPVAPRKSSTLLSVHSCNSLSSDLRQRTRNLSGGSPRPRHAKKIHFIKNMKQYDTRGSRIVLICAKRSLCAAFSVLPYGESFYLSEPALSHPRRRHSSGNISTSLEMTALEGFHMETYSRSVSYARFLYPTDALVRRKPSSAADPTPQVPLSRSARGTPAGGFPPGRLNSAVGLDLGRTAARTHARTDCLSSKGPMSDIHLQKRENSSVKKKNTTLRVSFIDPSHIKRSHSLVSRFAAKDNKHNRKLVSAACILLAAKISSDLRKQEVIHLIDKLEERFRIGRRELISFEFTILVALEMALYLPESKVMPHYRRLVQQQL
ncbi:CDK5 and ABL1 enzyme substrate 2-like, partial [Hippocampus comes]|uniref:CDK5 and ABL1 enzyme substrate 2-like n=1 Tax=Hippocampus comes TaxID=109280 RepID=UPI00094F2F4A